MIDPIINFFTQVFYWIGRGDRQVIGFIGLYQRNQNIQAITIRCACVGVALHQPGNLFQGGCVVGLCVDRANVHIDGLLRLS